MLFAKVISRCQKSPLARKGLKPLKLQLIALIKTQEFFPFTSLTQLMGSPLELPL